MQTRPQLLETVWEAQPDIQTRTVDMHVQRLRTKLGEAGRLIETVRGFGYRFRGTSGEPRPVTFATRLVAGHGAGPGASRSRSCSGWPSAPCGATSRVTSSQSLEQRGAS